MSEITVEQAQKGLAAGLASEGFQTAAQHGLSRKRLILLGDRAASAFALASCNNQNSDGGHIGEDSRTFGC